MIRVGMDGARLGDGRQRQQSEQTQVDEDFQHREAFSIRLSHNWDGWIGSIPAVLTGSLFAFSPVP
jgi:hypothetical protein